MLLFVSFQRKITRTRVCSSISSAVFADVCDQTDPGVRKGGGTWLHSRKGRSSIFIFFISEGYLVMMKCSLKHKWLLDETLKELYKVC